MNRVLASIRDLARMGRRALLAESRAASRRRPLKPGTVLYESFSGNGALCNPEAIFREMLAAPDLQHLRHVWVLDDGPHTAFRQEFASDPRVRIVRWRSRAYWRALSTAGTLINNATFPPEFEKRPGQRYLNTWHGTPLKAMGYDMPDGAFHSANTMRNFFQADWLLSQNPFMTERMYADAYRLRGAWHGEVIESGYPRVDRQSLDRDARARTLRALRHAGVEVADDERIVLYAPTWRGEHFGRPVDDAGIVLSAAERMQQVLGDGWRVLAKTHQAVSAASAGLPGLRTRLVPNDLPTNVALGLADVLVTDYSSIFFDYLATGRPIVFYTPDRELYAGGRGLYFPPEQLPGPAVEDAEAAAAEVLAGPSAEVEARRARWAADFTGDDDGGSAARVVDVVFRGRPQASIRRLDEGPAKPSLLLYAGGMRSNGITSSVLSLLSEIDHDAVDVSVLVAHSTDGQQRVNTARIDGRVRQFHRIGGMNGSKFATLAMRARVRRRPASAAVPDYEARLWTSEWRRLFGGARFDTVADFSGYSRLWSQILLHADQPTPRRVMWLHNEMASEVNRLVNGRPTMQRSLPAVFAHYDRYDALVSVSPSLAAENAANFAGPLGIPREKFVAARNLIDADHVLDGLRASVLDALEFTDARSGARIIPSWAMRLDARGRDGTRWFVTVGRLSPEKNQARLVRAFAAVVAEHPEARLLIVGSGYLASALQRQVDALGLGGRVFLAGALSNPFAVLGAADCFVLSSDHEGQPMVLLEAAIAGLPVISVRFASVADALPERSMLVVDQTDAALADGMRTFLAGGVPPASLDVDAYNAEALAETMHALLPAIFPPAYTQFRTGCDGCDQ